MSSRSEGSRCAARIELRSQKPPRGSFVLENIGGSDLRVWRPGNSWGDSALAFRVKVDDQTVHIAKALQDYTRNVPATVSVPPGGHYEYPFDLGDGTWQPAAALAQLDRPGAELAGAYQGGDTPEAREQGLWQGELLSRWYPLQ